MPFTTDIEQENHVTPGDVGAGEGRRSQARGVGVDAELLLELPGKSGFGKLAPLDLAARNLPPAGPRPVGRALLEKPPPPGVDQSSAPDRHSIGTGSCRERGGN